MTRRDTRDNVALHRFAVAVVCATFCLIIAGGLVTSTGSALAVPDWPLSYGQVMPPMTGGIFYEHGHRMVATFVGLLTVILAFWLWRREPRRWVRTLGWIALLSVVAQGVLGGLTVLFLLPTPISVSHAALAQSFFCLTIILAAVTAPSWESDPVTEVPSVSKTRTLVLATTGAIFLQLLLGALMRHTESGLAIPDFPLAYGHLLPPFDTAAMADINAQRLQLDLPPVEFSQIWIHFAHRVGALLVAVVTLLSVRHVFVNFTTERAMREPALVLFVLVVMQVLLGALTVWTGKNIETATAHVATGALLLGTSVVLSLRSYHLFRPAPAPVRTSLIPEGERA